MHWSTLATTSPGACHCQQMKNNLLVVFFMLLYATVFSCLEVEGILNCLHLPGLPPPPTCQAHNAGSVFHYNCSSQASAAHSSGKGGVAPGQSSLVSAFTHAQYTCSICDKACHHCGWSFPCLVKVPPFITHLPPHTI